MPYSLATRPVGIPFAALSPIDLEGTMQISHGADPCRAQTKGRVLVIDEDPQYGRLLLRALQHEGFDGMHLGSLEELGGLSMLEEFDAAIVDFFQGQLDGMVIEDYVNLLGRHGVDVIVTSELDIKELRRRCDGQSWPTNVHRFLCKGYGLEPTLDAVYDLIQARDMLYQAALGVTNQDTP
jgi:DNA-binding NtrC family response regulator